MRGTFLVARRELSAYFNALWGYVVVAAILVIDGLLFNAFAMGDTAKYSSKVLEQFFFYSFGLTAIATVLMTMRLLAEERQTGTIVLLDSSPLSDAQLVGGKYISALVVLVLMLAATVYMPALIFVNGKVSYGHIAAGYLGLVLVAGTVASIGMFASTVSKSQLVAGVISATLTAFFVLSWLLAKVTDAPLNELFSYMSLFDRHFKGFMRGKILTEDVVYYVSVSFLFLMLSTRFLAARRWR